MVSPIHADDFQASLAEVLITPELVRRKSRRPDYGAENRALAALAAEMATDPQNLPQKLVDLTLELCGAAGSAGISLLEATPEGETICRWTALAGAYKPYAGATEPVERSPCGLTLEHGEPQLFSDPARHFACLRDAKPPIVETLIIPLTVAGRARGTVWFASHDQTRQFDAEDLRLVRILTDFTAAGLRFSMVVEEKTQAAAVAIKNTRPYQQTQDQLAPRERAEGSQAGQTRVLELMALGAPLAEVLETLVRTIEEQSRSGMLGSFLLLDQDGVHLRHAAAPSLPETYNQAIDGIVIGAAMGSCGTAAYRKEAVYVSDVASDPLWVDFREVALAHNLRACWSTPIFSSQGDVLGAFAMYYAQARQPKEDDLRLVELTARTAAVAIERKRAEEMLRETDRRKDEFLATLAHELRNPLAPLQNALEILRINEGDRKSVSRTRETMEHQVKHLARLVDDLLDVSRITRGKIELRKERVNLRDVMQEAIETSRPFIDTAGHDLRINLPYRPLYVDGDPMRLTQVVANLLNNAVNYTDGAGRIELDAAREANEAVVRVRDTGIGISPELLPRIFDLFTQAETASKRAQGGLGIGLTLAKQIVELHGGRIEAKSEGLNHGSELMVRLPLAAGAPMALNDAPPTERDSEASPRKILVVDDNSAAADTLAELLGLHGNDTRAVNDGQAALDACAAWRPDVVVLDIGMPGMDGYEVARRVRQRPKSNDVLLIALTGWGQETDRELARRAGFDHHLLKPLDLQALRNLLESPARL